jgi:apolipoprotein N-acyltransferase
VSAPLDRPLAPARRFLGALAAALLVFAGSPGVLSRDGSALAGVLGLAAWSLSAGRPPGLERRRAWLAEGLAGAIGGALLLWWVAYVIWPGLLVIGPAHGAYLVLAGILLRRLARRLPLPLATGFAWTGVETLRAWLEPPLALGWLRLGHECHARLWLSGGARVLGVEGLSFALASLGGGLAALALERRARRSTLAWALGPAALAALCAVLVPPPVTVAGPRVLLVQPGFEQARKQYGDPVRNFRDSQRLTLEGLAELERRGEPPVDLVCWGESMLPLPVFGQEVVEGVERGLQLPPWSEPLDAPLLRELRGLERELVGTELVGAFPEGTSFCAGVEVLGVVAGRIRRRVGLALYDPEGERAEPALKQKLVPLGETMFGLERFELVRDMAQAAAGYVPDFVAGDEVGLLTLNARDGRSYRFAGTVCFDNAHVSPYVAALRSGPVDFHLVASNEAWYRESCELDQMVAFSRLIALATGRSFVRATNSGVSLVLAPDGREVGRLEVEGRDRSVCAAAAFTVPVPAPGARSPTVYVRLFDFWRPFWVGGLLVLAALSGARKGNPPGEAG